MLGGVLRSIADSLEQVTRLGSGTANTLEAGFSQVGSAAMALGGSMVAAGALIVSGMYASAKSAADFQSQLVLLQTHAGASQDTMRQLGAYALTAAGQLGFDPTSLAEAVYHVQSSLTSLGMSANSPKAVAIDEGVLYASAQLAAIGHANLEDSVNAVTKAFVVYQKDGYSAASITAIFNKTVGEGNMRLQELNTAFSSGLLPVAEQAGIKLESLGAALATMTDEGVPAARAAIYLRSAIIQMSVPSNAAVTALEAIGVSANDAQSQIGSFSQVLVAAGVNQTDVAKELQKTGSLGDTMVWLRDKIEAAGLSSQDAGALMDKAFGGIRSGTGVVTLYNNLDGLIQKEKDANSATADWQHTWETFSQQDPNFMLNRLQASWDSLVIILGTSFLPVMLQVVTTMIPLVERLGLWIAQNQDLVASVAQGAAVFLIVGGAIVFVSGVIARVIGVVIQVIEFFWNLGTTIAVAAETVDEFGASVISTGGVIADMFGGPVTWAITVVLALIAVGVLLVTHWQQIEAFARMVWGLIGGYVRLAFNEIKAIIGTELSWIVSIWNQHHSQIMTIAQAAWTAIKVLFLGALIALGAAIVITAAVIVGLVIAILALAAGIMWVYGKFMDLIQFLANFAVQAWKVLTKFFNDVTEMAAEKWAEFTAHPAYWIGYLLGFLIVSTEKGAKIIWDWLVNIAQMAWDKAETLFNNFNTWMFRLPGMLGNALSQLPGIFQSWMNDLGNRSSNSGQDIHNRMMNELNKLPGEVYNVGRSIVQGLWNGIQSLASWIWGQVTSWVAGLVQGMKDTIISGSPSMLVAREIGVPMSQGIAMGLMMDLPNTQTALNTALLGLVSQGANTTQNAANNPININQNQNQAISLTLDNNVLAQATIRNVNNWRDISELA